MVSSIYPYLNPLSKTLIGRSAMARGPFAIVVRAGAVLAKIAWERRWMGETVLEGRVSRDGKWLHGLRRGFRVDGRSARCRQQTGTTAAAGRLKRRSQGCAA
jgi:hypothetical protein